MFNNLEDIAAIQPPAAGTDRPSIAPTSHPLAIPEQSGSQVGWVMFVSWCRINDTHDIIQFKLLYQVACVLAECS